MSSFIERLTDEQLRDRIEDYSDELADMPLTSTSRRFTERLRDECEHELDVRAGLIDPYTGLRVEDAREADQADDVELPFGDRLAKLEVVS